MHETHVFPKRNKRLVNDLGLQGRTCLLTGWRVRVSACYLLETSWRQDGGMEGDREGTDPGDPGGGARAPGSSPDIAACLEFSLINSEAVSRESRAVDTGAVLLSQETMLNGGIQTLGQLCWTKEH